MMLVSIIGLSDRLRHQQITLEMIKIAKSKMAAIRQAKALPQCTEEMCEV